MSRPSKEMSFARQPLNRILSSAGAVRVMRALLAHGSYLPAPRVATDARMSSNAVREILADLEFVGAVDTIGSARARLFGAAPGHPIVGALDALFEAERGRHQDILSALKASVADSHIVAAWLFGSVARYQDRAESDWDVAVVVETGKTGLFDVAERVRDAIRPEEGRLVFTASIIAIEMSDISRLATEGSLLWVSLLNDAQVLKGFGPKVLAERLRRVVR